MNKLMGYSIVVSGALASTPAFAGAAVSPAPIIAAGIPGLLAVGAGYLIARKRRNR